MPLHTLQSDGVLAFAYSILQIPVANGDASFTSAATGAEANVAADAARADEGAGVGAVDGAFALGFAFALVSRPAAHSEIRPTTSCCCG